MAQETITVRLEADDSTDEIDVSTTLVEMLKEGEEGTAEVIGDLALLSLAQQAHGAVHHGHGEVSEELAAAEAVTMETFEERFGESFAEMTGHDH